MYFCQTTCTHLIPLTLSSPVDESFCCEFILFCLLLLHYVSWKVVMADVVFNLLCPCPQMLLTSSHTFLIGTLQTPPNVHIFSHMYQLSDPHIHLSNFMNRPKKCISLTLFWDHLRPHHKPGLVTLVATLNQTIPSSQASLCL